MNLDNVLTKHQRSVGLEVTDLSKDILILHDELDMILEVFQHDTPTPEVRKLANKYFNHKGTQCPYSPILCQEGWCTNCNLYLKEITNETP